MRPWYMITVVGKDQPGIVAAVTNALYNGDCNLGESSMIRLGGNFSIMMMVNTTQTAAALEERLEPVADTLALRIHIDTIDGALHHHLEADICIRVSGADRSGIVAEVTGKLAQCGFTILNLESDVGGSENAPLYIMHIEGKALADKTTLMQAIKDLDQKGIHVSIEAIDTLIG